MSDLPDDKRDELLGLLRAGHDVESACATLGISADAIAGNDGLKDEIAAAFKTGTSMLRGQILQSALSQENTAAMLKMLEAREAQQAAANETTIDVTDPAVRNDWARRTLFMLAEWAHSDPDRDAFLSSITRGRCLHCNAMPFERTTINASPFRKSLP